MFEDVASGAQFYVRYSKLHSRNQAFYGLRKKDLDRLSPPKALLCFIIENQDQPVILPLTEVGLALNAAKTAEDGQYKVAIFSRQGAYEFYVAGSGRLNVSAHVGWRDVENIISGSTSEAETELTHSQVQGFLATIGVRNGFDIWVPANDRQRSLGKLGLPVRSAATLISCFQSIRGIFEEIDVIWLKRGSGEPHACFEVEHSTPIYSGLLRFNDVHLVAPDLKPQFSVVAHESRRELFLRLVNRPTFRASGLTDLCGFIEYGHLVAWHKRVLNENEAALP
jgi:hypothetical protein